MLGKVLFVNSFILVQTFQLVVEKDAIPREDSQGEETDFKVRNMATFQNTVQN